MGGLPRPGYYAEYYQKNKETIAAKQRERRKNPEYVQRQIDKRKEAWQVVKNDPELLEKHRTSNTEWGNSPQGQKTRKSWISKNKESIRTRQGDWQKRSDNYKDIQRKHAYGLDKEACKNLFNLQSGCCGICEKPIEFYGLGTHLDHDHNCCPGPKSCGKCVRGFLCSNHNKGLGHFNDDPEMLRNAARYLERFK
jgi:hypothetical protein